MGLMEKFPPLLGLLLVLTILWPQATADGPVCPSPPDGTSFSRAYFPQGFMFGTAVAAFQVEGATNEGCRGPSLWDASCRKFPAQCGGFTDIQGTDFYHRYKEDIQIMKEMNTDALRLSISWPRVFPHGRKAKGVNQVGVKFYHDLIDELIKNGITPLVTVFHWDTPEDLEDEYGGFLSERIVKDFTEYAEFVFNEYGDKVKHWVTFNEPWVFSRAGYDEGKKAPFRCSKYIKESCEDGRSGYEAYLVSHNLLLAHAEAVQAFRKCEKCKGGKIGIAHSPAWFEPHAGQDSAAIDRALDFIFGWHVEPTTFGDYPQTMKDIVGHRLPKFTEEQKQKLRNSCDFLGFNYYSSFFGIDTQTYDPTKPSWYSDSRVSWASNNKDGFRIGSKPETGKFAVYSQGLKELLKFIKEKYNNPEIIITENGYGENLGADDENPKVAQADYNRKYYHQRHLLGLREAICDYKVNVTGYFAWSLYDNFEWQDGYGVRFGLYHIDYKNNLTRTPKVSGLWYRDFLKRETAPSNIKQEL